jgi:3-hydroxyisobutyrate dehydrogenase-like beta-hydroxyacid dehydrogenase
MREKVMAETVGWIGVGSMGSRMAANLAKGGYQLVVADKMSTEHAPAGSIIAANNAEVARAAEVVILSVPAGLDSLAIVDEFIAVSNAKVKTVVDTSTIGIPHAREAAERLAAHGIEYVDAPVSGGIAGAEAASLAVMTGCSPETHARLKPMLECIGKNVIHVGSRAGQGQTVKLLNNFLSATAMAATSEAMAFGTANGLDMQAILDVVNVSSGRNTATMDKFPNRIANEAYNGGFATKMMAKDVRLYVENVASTGTTDQLASMVAETFARLEDAEPGSDFTRIYPFVREGFGS